MAKEIRCTECGAKCLDTDTFCGNCHATLNVQGKRYEDPIEGIDVSLWRQFIGKKSETFLRLYRKNEGKKFFLDFNPYAFLFKSGWFFYRKMYVQGVIVEVLANLYLAVLEMFLLLMTANRIPLGFIFLAIPLAFLFPISLGLLSPLVYRKHVMRSIKKNDMVLGGTSLTAFFAAIIIFTLLKSFVVEPLAVLLIGIFF